MAELNRSASGVPYESSGAGAPAFVFLAEKSGAPAWASQVEDISRTNQCMVVEVSDIDGLARLLGELQPGPVILAGHGSNGLLSLPFFEHFPEAVNGVLLIDPPLPPGEDAERLRAEGMLKLVDRKPFMVIWPEQPAGDPAWLRDITMFVRQEPVAGATSDPRSEQPSITNALLRAFLDDVKNDPRLD